MSGRDRAAVDPAAHFQADPGQVAGNLPALDRPAATKDVWRAREARQRRRLPLPGRIVARAWQRSVGGVDAPDR